MRHSHLVPGKCREVAKIQYFEAWLSLVERSVRDAEAAGSNPVASIDIRVSGKTLFLILEKTKCGGRLLSIICNYDTGLFGSIAWDFLHNPEYNRCPKCLSVPVSCYIFLRNILLSPCLLLRAG